MGKLFAGILALFGKASPSESSVIEGSGSANCLVVLKTGETVRNPETEYKVSPDGKVYTKFKGKWVEDTTIFSLTYTAKPTH